MPVHYAPRTPAFRVEGTEEWQPPVDRGKVALVQFGEPSRQAQPPVDVQFLLETPDEASTHLYDVLHHCDSLGLDAIIVVMPADLPQWQAVRDRLLCATRPLEETR